jgi:hypothetical protein
VISPKTLANADSLGQGPIGSFKINGRRFYPTRELAEWLDQRIRRLPCRRSPGPMSHERPISSLEAFTK